MPKQMTKLEAVREIIADASFPANKKRNRRHMLRVERACATLELTGDETAAILRVLEYADSSGRIYTCFLPTSEQ